MPEYLFSYAINGYYPDELRQQAKYIVYSFLKYEKCFDFLVSYAAKKLRVSSGELLGAAMGCRY